MNFSESFLTALDSLLANKLRSILTMLGVIIGVAAVIALLALGNGFSEFITSEIQSIGTNLIVVTTNNEVTDGAPALTIDDVEALSDPVRAPSILDVSATLGAQANVLYEGNDENTSISGVSAAHFRINNFEMAIGDVLTENDVDSRARVAVLGSEISSDLFGEEYPIGRSIKINGASYEVVGVLEQRGGPPNVSGNDAVYIPITTAQVRLSSARTRDGQRAVNSISVQATSEETVEQAMEEITLIMREQHNIAYAADDDFQLFSQSDLLETFGQITGTLTLFLGAIAGISLLVGGIGIMNIMLVSVTERTREIGIRKAVGALKRDILMQFLIESLFMSLVGGFLGIALGFGLSAVASNFLGDVEPVVDLSTILLATGFSAGVGLIFGIYPAWRASGLQPIEALRYE